MAAQLNSSAHRNDSESLPSPSSIRINHHIHALVELEGGAVYRYDSKGYAPIYDRFAIFEAI
jgi:hypothetical protein